MMKMIDQWRLNKNDVMRLGERPRSLEGKPNITGTDRERQTGSDTQGLTDRERQTGRDRQGLTDRERQTGKDRQGQTDRD